MNIDSRRLLYFNELSKGKEIIFPNTQTKKNQNDKSKFYELLKYEKYLIKYSLNELKCEDIFTMLTIFSELKDKIILTNLPIGYFQEKELLKGTIVPYYRDSISLYQITKDKNLNELINYYYHDDNKLHNLYLLFNDILDILEELQNNGISYFDSNPGNFILKDNQVKLIDFDPKYLKYGITNENIKETLSRFDDLLFHTHLNLRLDNLSIYKAKDFQTMRKHLIKLENKIRKKYY